MSPRTAASRFASAQLIDEAGEPARRIALRYLGEAAGSEYAEPGLDDMLIRLEPGRLRAWDFSDEYPE